MKERYINIQEFMVRDLGLKGNELLIYAIIYGFCQDDSSNYRAGNNYISAWLKISQRTVVSIINSLMNKKLIIQNKETNNACTYEIVSQGVVKNFHKGVVKNFHKGCEKVSQGGCEKVSLSTLKDNKYINNKVNNKERDTKAHSFIPPTLSEVEEYCQLRKNKINPNQFINFYESKGWMIGKNKMKDWKACIKTWEQRSNPSKKIDRDEYNKKLMETMKKEQEEKEELKKRWKEMQNEKI